MQQRSVLRRCTSLPWGFSRTFLRRNSELELEEEEEEEVHEVAKHLPQSPLPLLESVRCDEPDPPAQQAPDVRGHTV